MSYHGDLILQAHHLATREPRRPRQASLRRAVSSAYYALFHLLIHEGVGLMLAGRARENLRLSLSRAYVHGKMKLVATGFANNNVSAKIRNGLNGQALPPALIRVAEAFVDLQQARHEADYDLGRRFTRQETLDLVVQAQNAFTDWQRVRGTIQADTFLVALLAQEIIQGR